MSAHKLVLSACSEYFKSIFQSNKKHSNPIICLHGLDYNNLKNILDYIYNGEVQIYQDHIDRFLKVAKKFKLEDLLAMASFTKAMCAVFVMLSSNGVGNWNAAIDIVYVWELTAVFA